MAGLDPIRCEANGCTESIRQHAIAPPAQAFDPVEDRVVVKVLPGWLVAWSRKGAAPGGRMVVLCPAHAAGAAPPEADHFHGCPACYEPWPCWDTRCTIEPDLSDRGRRFGCHCTCARCETHSSPAEPG